MPSILLDYYFTLLEVLVILCFIGVAGIAVFWGIGRRWRNRLKTLEQKHTDELASHDSEYFQALHHLLQESVAHELVKGLDYISRKSEETLEELGEEQSALRDKQHRIIAKVNEMIQHALNILAVFAPERDELQRELLSIRQLVEHVLLELYLYAQSRGVTLMPNLGDVEPIALNRDLTLRALRNVIHNAIKFSHPGGVVEIILFLENPGKVKETVCVEVRDTGRGMREEDKVALFELRKRGDSRIEPGSGLGLYLARKAARRQGGDVILMRSSLNQGSVFRIILPYR